MSNQLSVDVLVSSPWTTSRLLLSYFNIYRVDDPQFKVAAQFADTPVPGVPSLRY